MPTLITHAGDMGDVDGFYALAEYAKTGADVLFILNYPAYFDVKYTTELQTENAHGLGYTYSASAVLEMTRRRFLREYQYRVYEVVLKKYGLVYDSVQEKFLVDVYDNLQEKFLADVAPTLSLDVAPKLKQMYTLLALVMCHAVWNACPTHGELYFCVGGVNSVDPFDIYAVNNELLLFADILGAANVNRNPNITEGSLLTPDGSVLNESLEAVWAKYTAIYIDFNGSMAFLTPIWKTLIETACTKRRVKGAFIQGGVYSYLRSKTIPKRNQVINRMSCAIMNQLYSPRRSKTFFDLMKEKRIPMYVVANNDIEDLGADYHRFFRQNDINYPPIIEYAERFYGSRDSVRVKPYDFYVALVICTAIKTPGRLVELSLEHTLLYNPIYAATLLCKEKVHYTTALMEYFDALEIDDLYDKMAVKLHDKAMWQIERSILMGCDWAEYSVRTFLFKSDKRTMRLTIEPPPQPFNFQ
jgi:hypothetical protein